VWNQIPVTLGNLVGGLVFTGLALFITFGRRTAEPAASEIGMEQPAR
jgi:formate/nitrite transporter FocA (FNT family)